MMGRRLVRSRGTEFDRQTFEQRNFNRPDGVLELLIEDDVLVGQGFVDQTYQPGMELHYLKLIPDEVAVCVTEVFQGSLWVGEVVGERLEQCVGLVIR